MVGRTVTFNMRVRIPLPCVPVTFNSSHRFPLDTIFFAMIKKNVQNGFSGIKESKYFKQDPAKSTTEPFGSWSKTQNMFFAILKTAHPAAPKAKR